MGNQAKDILSSRFVLFSCEGTAEGVVVQVLYDNDLLIVPRERVVKDALIVDRLTRENARRPKLQTTISR